MEVHFNIFHIKVNGMSSSSAFNVGTNLLIGFESNSKSINGNSDVNGDNGVLPCGFAMVDDRDHMDSPVVQSGPDTVWLPALGSAFL